MNKEILISKTGTKKQKKRKKLNININLDEFSKEELLTIIEFFQESFEENGVDIDYEKVYKNSKIKKNNK
ncbi:hypothetical protein [Mycoplasma leonicaptivi]|uniref:hypothetical protein n=1 Tax=Mycoplasma leonicaptivi TaxID=36742 RepID=UPI0005685F89|nr:hypothetical protein [Mycoplasma leonicaptivi]